MEPQAHPPSEGEARIGRGANAAVMRNHNERAILTLLRENRLSGKELADALRVSAQTASVITRHLEAQSLIMKGEPKKGKVGKPQIPWALNPDGAYGIGLRIGRRSADFLLMDLIGQPRFQKKTQYRYPTPEIIDQILRENLSTVERLLGAQADRITGFGIAAPFELWSWGETFKSDARGLDAWRDHSFEDAIAQFSPMPVFVANDITMACNGELLYGAGQKVSDFGYFYVGALVGGGVVLNGQIFQGPLGNAGAFASIPIGQNNKQLAQLASISALDARISKEFGRKATLGADPSDWSVVPHVVDAWLDTTAQAISIASVGVKAVLDVPHILIDGGFPETVKLDLLNRIRTEFDRMDQRGLNPTHFLPGILGETAGARGAANLPLHNAHFLEGARIG